MADEKAELEKVIPSDDAQLARPGYPRTAGFPYATGNAYGYGYGEEEEGVHLREIWRIARKRKWLILTITFIITTIVTIEAYRTKSSYMATAFIEIGKENATIQAGPNDTVIRTDDSDIYYPELSINTHLFRLTSEPLLEDVVVKLKLDENPKFVEPARNSIWQAIQAIGGKAGAGEQEEAKPAVVDNSIPGLGRNLSRSQQESERLAPYVGAISSAIQAEQVKNTRTLKVSFTHTDPVIAAAVSNGVAQSFIEQSFENKTEKFTKASDWLDTTTRELKAKVEQSEQRLADYTRQHNIFSIEGKETLTTDKLSRMHDQATRAETERILKESLFEVVKAGNVTQLPAAFVDPKILNLQKRLEELQVQSDKLDLKYGPDYPAVVETRQEIVTTKAQIEKNRKDLEDKLKSEYSVALREEQALKAALAASKGEAVQQNQDAIQYNILKQEVETAKGLYTDFLQKTNQAKVEVAQQHNNFRLIQPARVPRGPIGPNRLRTIRMGLLLSLVAAIGLAYFLEYIDSSIKTVEDVGRYMRLPALGVIPAMATGAGLLNAKIKGKNLLPGGRSNGKNGDQDQTPYRPVALDTRSSAAEAYRVVRTSILLSAAGHPPKTTLVTSGQPGEGKTTTVINTAISLAQLGSSVLIMDCDLRRPTTHKIFGVETSGGLSSYLSRDIKVDGLIQKLQIPNLSLFPCGPIPPNPAELISSDWMKDLLRSLSEQYDHILIDSPPLINVTDSVILSAMVDGVILVVHGGKSSRGIAQRARQELTSVGAKIFGVVLNNVDMRREGYGHYYYQKYYSGYEQGGPEANA
jgi:capsular exopolysaccharide synthesis family protein